MRTIYIDDEYKCYTENTGTLKSIETDFFDGKCDFYIKGYRFIPDGKSWTREDNFVFVGEMVTPWKPYTELDTAQREYERQLIQDQAATIAELDAALLDMTYQNIIGSIE